MVLIKLFRANQSLHRTVFAGIALAAVALIGIAVLELCIGPRGLLGGFDRSKQSRYELLVVGDSKQDVIDALGEPRVVTDSFNLPQRQGFERLFDAAKRTSAVDYYQWINGMNWYYCIGFDSDGVVVIKGEGHS